MSTQDQVNANRANSQLSTGPKTEQGKAVSCLNHLSHGLSGGFRVLSWEKQGEFDALLAGLREEHNPSGATEVLLIEKMAQHLWLSRRALTLQDGALEENPKQLELYLRYQTTHDRAFHKCLTELAKLRAEKRKVEIGFELQERKRKEEARKRNEDARQQAQETRRQEMHEARIRILNFDWRRREEEEKRRNEPAELPVLRVIVDEGPYANRNRPQI